MHQQSSVPLTPNPQTQAARRSLEQAFKLFDVDKSGWIEPHELAMLMRRLSDWFCVMHPTEKEVYEIFKEVDLNGDGKISKKQFQLLVDEIVKIVEENEQKNLQPL